MVEIENRVIVPPSGRHDDVLLDVLDYLEALTFDFEREGQQVSAVLVYAEPDATLPGLYQPVVARETGFEGIACVDDTARAAYLALGVYEFTGSPRALSLARRWLSFVEYMQYPNGCFANFIRNAVGIRNASGPTSRPGGYWWSSRALLALARAYRIIGDENYLARYEACKLEPIPDGKINAIQVLADLELYRAEPSPALTQRIGERCRTIIGADSSAYFRDHPDSDRLYLWGYHQLHAVAEAAFLLQEPAFIKPCWQTVEHVIEPDVRDRFWYDYPARTKNGVCAYCVTPIVQGLRSMHRATGAERYRELALRAAAWFYGRNDAGTPMYDPTTGRCRDGINDAVASVNYGAESAVEAGITELERRALIDRI